jgi:MinD superfamily P-loop ATPase
MQVIQVMEELCHGCGACSYACGFGAIVEKPVSLGNVSGYQLNGGSALIESRTTVGVMSPVPLIKAAIGKIELDADISLFDSPPGTSCPFIQTVARADFVVLVTEPTPFGLSDLRQSVETLRQIEKPFGVIVNKAGLGNRDVYKYLDEEDIPLLLEIPFSREIAIAYTSGQMAVDAVPSLGEQFFQFFSTLKLNYGNSHHKR